LLAARKRRDDTFRLLARAIGASEKPKARDAPPQGRSHRAAKERYQLEVREADDIADRLRREAEPVGRLAALLAEREACHVGRAVIIERAQDHARTRATEQQAWRALWQPAGVDPEPPAEMRGFLARHGALVKTIDELRRFDAERSALKSAIDAHR